MLCRRLLRLGYRVSIHAPLRGATIESVEWVEEDGGFNPRTPAGCDFMYAAGGTVHIQFQSTHPCGVRRSGLFISIDAGNVSIHAPLRGATGGHSVRRAGAGRFNPRTPAGCDKGATKITLTVWGFNPRTPAGCDNEEATFKFWKTVFQSSHPCGVRPSFTTHAVLEQAVSIHAPLRGATPSVGRLRCIIKRFQSTHPCGVRPLPCRSCNLR